MSLLQYSKCRIEFLPTGSGRSSCEYSDRSFIELRQDNDGQYLLRGVDVANNKAEIFKFQLIEGLYKLGSGLKNYDEIRCSNGTYRLWLNSQTEGAFYKELRGSLDELAMLKKSSSDIHSEKIQPSKQLIIPTNINDQENILINIHKLGEHIKKGEPEKAGELAFKLASEGIQLKPKTLDTQVDDEKFRIRVKIDGIDIPSSDTNELCTVNVYPSTTIHELRTLFQHKCGFSKNQYFFVNSHLAYAESTMADLKAEKNTLFVLFLTEKCFENTQF